LAIIKCEISCTTSLTYNIRPRILAWPAGQASSSERDICSNERIGWGDIEIVGSFNIGNEEFVEFEQITLELFSTE